MSQDTLSATPSEARPETFLAPAVSPNRTRTSLVVAGLGVNAWLACAGWPALVLQRGPLVLGLALTALASLLGGVIALQLRQHSAARWILSCAYPGTLACAVASIAEPDLERAHTALSLSLAALALLAYCAAAVIACKAPLAQLTTESHPLDVDPAPARTRDLLRKLVLTLLVAGAFAIAVLAPLSPAWTQVEGRWREAAGAGATLAAVVGGALAVNVLAFQVGSLLRRADAPTPPSPSERRLRVATLLFVSLLGAVVYFTIRQ